MSNKRRFLALVIVSVFVFALAWDINTSSAQGGPGGRRGNGGQGQCVDPQNCVGMGQQQQNGAGQGFGAQGNAGQGLGQQNGAGQGFGAQGNAGQGFGQQNGTCEYCLSNLPPAVPGDVPADVVDALTAGLADEHNAYNTYQAIIDQFGAVRPFTNIQRAEANHIAELEFLFERYSLALPEIAPLAEVPQFATLAEACAAGVVAETANLELYNTWIATVQDYPDMVQIFTSLKGASELQHLPAFEQCAG